MHLPQPCQRGLDWRSSATAGCHTHWAALSMQYDVLAEFGLQIMALNSWARCVCDTAACRCIAPAFVARLEMQLAVHMHMVRPGPHKVTGCGQRGGASCRSMCWAQFPSGKRCARRASQVAEARSSSSMACMYSGPSTCKQHGSFSRLRAQGEMHKVGLAGNGAGLPLGMIINR